MNKYSVLLKNVSYQDIEATHHYLDNGFWHFEVHKQVENAKTEVRSIAIIQASEIVWIKVASQIVG